ncbi:MAG: hypothetical protein IPK04_14095 [Bdellovibrionales bacterium]|nr:hypothetical protein [Bdellovibrionales bacterium]
MLNSDPASMDCCSLTHFTCEFKSLYNGPLNRDDAVAVPSDADIERGFCADDPEFLEWTLFQVAPGPMFV